MRDANGQDTSALQMAQAAWRENPHSSDAYGALLQQELYWRGIDRILPPQHIAPTDRILSTADGQRLIIKSADPTTPVSLWQGLAGPAPQSRALAVNPTSFLELSPDGRLLAESGNEPGVKIWDLDSPAPPLVLRADDATAFQSVSFSANGRYLAGVPNEVARPRHLQIWDLRTRRAAATTLPATLATGMVNTVYPTDDGRQVVLFEQPSDPNAKTEAVVRDTATGALVRSLGRGVLLDHGRKIAACDAETATHVDLSGTRLGQLASGVDCSSLDTDLTGQFVLLNRPGAGPLGAVHWPDGKRYLFADPTVTVNWATASTSPTPVLLPAPDGRLIALTVRNGSMQLSTVPTTDAKPADATSWNPSARSPDGQRWAARTKTGELALLDAHQQVLKQVSVPSPTALSFDASGKHVLSVGNGMLRTYRADDLALEHEAPLPGGPSPNENGTVIAVPGQNAVVVYAKTATFWDPATGQQTAAPLPLTTQADVAEAKARPGHPGQIFVYGGKTAAVWDLPSRKAVETFRSDFFPGTPAIDPTGSFAAMVNGVGSGVVLLDLNANRMLPTMPASMNTLHGIDGEYLFGEATLDFQVWHWPDHKLVTDAKLGDLAEHRSVENGKLFLDTRPGRSPAVPLDGAAWMRHLCGINDRDFTPAEKTRLPAGAEQSRPCAQGS
ncbi:WD40 repeat domain-containing protein [Amycolatopsis sp. FU40]|uniref:WD40 repeat domain-containing protein n=1 Tax=Amycolatopsis sp. FU40 TaxID=2914159 RepID=UPI001F1843B0|nr:WD40 repeat domain-containing protein [Amycolatopsis sp. FU40]UKD51210.1 WD40 repeat domain-containing protein [Amycolatopsis sp. FU40]